MSNTFKASLSTLFATTALVSALPAFAQETAPQVEDKIVVTGRFIPDEKRITSEISSVLDSEAFETTGAGDVAGALTRVTGLSLSQGKFVVVRGLNERYSSATLNGSPLPSPEPLRRVAPLDLFPTSVLSNVVVQKTFSAENSGEFGGGSIDMRTKALPDEGFFEVSLSGSFNTETTAENGLVTAGSSSDFTGFDSGLRNLPPLGPDGNLAPGENFENFRTLIIDNQNNIPGNFGVRLSAGERFDLSGGQKIGVLATVGYDNSWESRSGEDNTVNIGAGELEILDDGFKTSTENKIALNGLLSVGVEFNDDHEVKLTGLATRQSSAEARIISGVDREDRIFRQDFTEWFEREVYMSQLIGTHFFPKINDLKFSWRASYAEASRDAPYERRVNYEDFEDGQGFRFQFNRPGSNNEIRFSTLDDETLDFAADFVLPLSLAGTIGEFKFGGTYLDKTRNSGQADFRYFGSIPEELRNSRIDLIFSDEVVEAGILEIRRGGTSGFPDVSDAGLEVLASYAGFDIEVNEKLRFAAGLRYEDSEQTTSVAESTLAGSRFDFDALKEDFFLPALTVTWTFADNLQLRLAASKTINRPQFRELTPSIFVNTDTDDRFVGNPFLQNSASKNLDARLEWYFGAKQFFTIGGFYKDFTDPIEEFIFNGLGESNATSFLNAPSAELYGVEVEFEKKWDFADLGEKMSIFSGDALASKTFVLRSNYTYTDSSVSADGDVAITPPSINPANGVTPLVLSASGLFSDGRKLQGQSDHLANLQLGIEDNENDYQATFLLNYSSARIRAVEDLSNGLPSIIEQLPVTLDFVFNWDVIVRGGAYTLGLKAQNILNDNYSATQSLGDVTIDVDTYDLGRTFAINLKRRF